MNPGLGRWWSITAVILGVYFLLWWLHLRPGVFSFDSGFYLDEVLSRNLTNLKPYFYARFLQAVTLNGAVLELGAVVQALFVLLAFSRMFAIAVVTRTRRAWLGIGALLVLNPYVANMIFYVQNDILFSVAVVMITVETLYIVRQRSVSIASCVVIAVFAPMALLFRQNGIVFLPLWMAMMFMLLPKPQWLRVMLPATLTSLLGIASMAGVSSEAPGQRQDLLYPAVIHEVVQLARPGFRTAAGARLAPETKAAIGTNRLPLAVAYYWPLYWDTIAFFPNGPMLVNLDPGQRDAIVRSFLKHDLLANVPSVLGHRLEIFLGACLARAELADPYAVPPNLPHDLSASKARHAAEAREGSLLGRINQWSIDSRGWTWNALVGVVVLGLLTIAGLWRRDVPLLLCALLLWVQAAAIFVVAPSAEYRYVFALYLAPLLLLVGQPLVRRAAAATPALGDPRDE